MMIADGYYFDHRVEDVDGRFYARLVISHCFDGHETITHGDTRDFDTRRDAEHWLKGQQAAEMLMIQARAEA